MKEVQNPEKSENARLPVSSTQADGGQAFNISKAEEKILEFWEKNKIFQKSLDKTKDGEPFTFYDGPPFATGLPHYGHILASTIKDLIPRYQAMKGRFVRRRWGWDCHGLPIEEIVERHLGISGKKQIEEIGIKKFNEICREKVLEFADEWSKMVRRIARWINFDNSYKTMDRDYMESVWWAFKQIYNKGLVYEGRKVLMYCPRCETPVSNFEVALDNSYQDVTEEAVTVKFKLTEQSAKRLGLSGPTYLLAWTTTPWTLPGNVALAVGKDIEYVKVKKIKYDPPFNVRDHNANHKSSALSQEYYILGKSLLDHVFKRSPDLDVKEVGVNNLIGLEYEPLYIPAIKSDKSYKVYPADFVTTTDGTGIVHAAVVYGEDDYQLGLREGLPVVPLLDGKGKFNEKAPEFLQGTYFKDADKIVIADLEKRNLLFQKEKYTHSYPHCWRCGTMLFYNAIPAWFVNVQNIKKGLVESNDKEINWFPKHLKHGRYEKSVESAPDWNISRNRYWGNPIPVWKCEKGCSPIVVGSIKELGLSTNTFYFARHGEAESNVVGITSCFPEKETYDLTKNGIEQTKKLAEQIKKLGGVDMIYASDLLRTKHTSEIVGKILNAPVKFDERLREYHMGEFNGRPVGDFHDFLEGKDQWTTAPKGGESWQELQDRMIAAIKDFDKKNQNKKILVVSHADPLWLVQKYFGSELEYPKFAEPFQLEVGISNLHRPYIDDVVLQCPACGGEAHRITEIFDSWVEASSMPFAEYHYPFEQKEVFESRFPAQFVAEYIAQTRAWFYTMHVVSYAIFGKAPFDNVVTTGTILAEDGSKMSKSKNNFPDPWTVIEKYGVDALRFYLMNSPVMQADNLNFSVRDLENVYRKVIMILWNVVKYFETYAKDARWKYGGDEKVGKNVLDAWISARTKELINITTENLDGYDTVRATRAIAEYIDDLSTWYLRRSRGRKDKEFFETMFRSLRVTSQVIAPVMPYLAEMIHQLLKEFNRTMEESVHLSHWPAVSKLTPDEEMNLKSMAIIREAASIGQAMRKSLNIPVRQPLARVGFHLKDGDVPGAEFTQILLEELNIKNFGIKLSDEKREEITTVPGTSRVLDLSIDTAISDELRLEGLVRGLERAVQEARKKLNLKVGEMAKLIYKTEDEDLAKAIELFNKEKTYIKKVEQGKPAGAEEQNINGKIISLRIAKI